MSQDQTPFYVAPNTGFATIGPADDLLHPKQNPLVKCNSLTETQYFGFCIPEERIEAFCYLWHHPNLNLVSGGLFVWQGHKNSLVQSLLCDYRSYMSDFPLKNDLHEFRLENGYGVKIIEPLKRFLLTYADDQRQHLVNLHFDAIAPAVMFADGTHFEQAMKVTGQLLLRGKPYEVNCFTVRDRSWAKPRPEATSTTPNISWMQGVFNEDVSFVCNMFDQECTSPELGNRLYAPDDRAVLGGWIYRDGNVGRIVKGQKRIARLPLTFKAHHIELEITDEFNRTMRITGTSIASNTWVPWPNLYSPFELVRWECDGMVAYGECQEGIWNDYFNQDLS